MTIHITFEGQTYSVSTEQEDDGSWVAWIPGNEFECVGWGDNEILAVASLFERPPFNWKAR